MTWRDGTFMNVLECEALVIGAGGIGCELLKNLALTGFKNITVIDLDTIDISNLNRQFLFRKEHVGKSKAEVASEAIKQIRPDINITYFHDSVMSESFGVAFFKKFSIVLSALDNKAARSHVNRLCLVSGVPLIESGSAGYLGQVSVIIKGKSECYDCVPKPVQKTYPNCTIRNTPSEPIHCVVWAKALFNQLFGEKDPDNDVAPEIEDQSAEANGSGAAAAGEADGGEKQRISTRTFAENCDYDPVKLFNKFFHDDIHYLLSMTDLWKERKKPSPKNFDDLTSGGLGPSRELGPNMPWSMNRWAEVYERAVYALHDRYREVAKSNGVLTWDKDDEPAMNFVAACSNIRAHIFQIPTKTLFDVKSMAGNIIPAIATTNACVAGMIVVEALKIVRNKFDKSRCVFISRLPNPRGKILVDEPPCPPNKQCYVCSEQREVIVKVNLKKMLVKHLRQNVLVNAFNMRSPDVTDLFSKRILISSDEDETDDDLMEKSLSTLGVQNGTQLDCDDFAQYLQFKMLVFHSDELEAEQFELISSSEDLSLDKESKADGASDSKPANGQNAQATPTSDGGGGGDTTTTTMTATQNSVGSLSPAPKNGTAAATGNGHDNDLDDDLPEVVAVAENGGSSTSATSSVKNGDYDMVMDTNDNITDHISVVGTTDVAIVEVDALGTNRKRRSAAAGEDAPSKRVRTDNN